MAALSDPLQNMATFGLGKLFPDAGANTLTNGNENASATRAEPALKKAEKGLMPDFAVAHIVVRRQPYRRSMRLQAYVRTVLQQPIQIRRMRLTNAVASFVFSETDAVHND